MLLTDAEVTHLKSWLISKLETISEADSQILSDYVVALLQAESSEEAELKANVIENLTDFLGDNTKRFVEEVFSVIRSKRYIPGKALSPEKLKVQNEHHGHISTGFGEPRYEATKNSLESRKRHYDDFRGGYVDWDAPGEPNMKQSRKKKSVRARTGPRGRERFGQSYQKGRRDDNRATRLNAFEEDASYKAKNSTWDDAKETRSDNFKTDAGYTAPLYGKSSPGQALQNSGSDGRMSSVAAQPFDPNVALQAILTLQAMGFPIPFSGDMSVIAPSPNLSTSPTDPVKSQIPCRDYESRGVCLRGSSCRFQHQGHKIQSHGQDTDNAVSDTAPTWDAEAAQRKYEARKALLEQTELKRQELIAKQREIESQKAVELQKIKDILTTKGKKLPPDLEEASSTVAAGSEKTKQLLAQLKALEDEAKSLGLDEEPWFNGDRDYYPGNSYRGRGVYHRGWRGYPRRGRGHIRGTIPRNGAYNLDNRPKQVRVEDANFDSAKEESLKQHLFTVGDFESVETDADHKSCVITFRDRYTAETFYFGPMDIPGVGKVKFSWVTNLPASSTSTRNEDTEMLAQQEDLPGDQTVSNSKDGTKSLDHTVQREDDVDYGNEDYEWIV